MSEIHPQAFVETGARIGKGAVIEAFAVVKKEVTIGARARVKSHAYLTGRTYIGESTVVWPGACIGAEPQDLKYKGASTEVIIGNFCQIRESATVNKATEEGQKTEIGDHCLLMAYTHVGHNSQLGQRVVMSNNATLAGHVIVETEAVIGGMTAVHQFARIGKAAMVGGMSRITRDVAPYTLGAGAPYRLGGLNLLGLQRKDIALATRRALIKAFRLTFRSQLTLSAALDRIKKECPSLPEIEHWLNFCRTSSRGLIGFEPSLEDKDRRRGKKNR